jgi:glycerol-1-phosphate dehydrogenase [NAD(P)+]
LLNRYYHYSGVCIIADENTYRVAGEKVGEVLKARGIALAEALIFPGEPRLHAEYRYVTAIGTHLRSRPDFEGLVPIAAGGGTINDLVKRAAGELALPYLCVPTAASVDGYTSYGAALLAEGYKQTFPCPAPRVLTADTEILKNAPPYLSSSGFGDLAGKITAGTDWIIAEKAGALGAPGTEPIDPLAWSMTQNGLPGTLRRSAAAAAGDRDAVSLLFGALAVTGFAMQRLHSSRPVSGCEHLWSHIWEMEDLSVGGVPVTHGHKVAMGTLAATAFTELLFADPEPPKPLSRRPTPAEREAEVRKAFSRPAFGAGAKPGSPLQEGVVKTAAEKLLTGKKYQDLRDGLRDSWREIRAAVLEKLLPYGELRELMARGGCPCLPGDISLTRRDVIGAARLAQMIRNRYTVLDMAWDLGVFERILERFEETGGYLQ